MKKHKKNFFELTVKAVVLNEKNEILLLRRSENDPQNPGKYDFPGGGLEARENVAEGLIREIKEETGLQVEVETILAISDFNKSFVEEMIIGRNEVLIGKKGVRFLARKVSGEVKLSKEHAEFRWASFEEAKRILGEGEFEKEKAMAISKAQKYLEIKESLNGWKRALADFENYKKRQTQERKELISYGNMNLILEILPVIDNFHAATEHIPASQKDDAWVTGIMYIQKQLEQVLANNGVSEIEVKIGEDFDPEIMEAIGDTNNTNEHTNDTSNRIKKLVQKGYKINNKIIRVARVVVE